MKRQGDGRRDRTSASSSSVLSTTTSLKPPVAGSFLRTVTRCSHGSLDFSKRYECRKS